MSSDRLIEFEEYNWEELVEKFIAQHRKEWEEFVYEEWSNTIGEYPPK